MSDERTYTENEVEKYKQNKRNNQKRDIREALAEVAIAIEESDYYTATIRLANDIIPYFIQSKADLDDYHLELQDEDGWSWVPMLTFIEDPESYVEFFQIPTRDDERSVKQILEGVPAETERKRREVKTVFRSCELIAEYEGVVKSGLQNKAIAKGFQTVVGVHRQPYEMDLGSDEIRLVTEDSGKLKTLYAGETGQAKSSTEETEVYDAYARGHKILDVIDMDSFENCVYDIPQQQDILRKIRKEHDLPEDFTEDESLPEPEVEILVPYTPGLEQQEFPFDVESREFTVKPFTVPASSLSKQIMVSIIASELSKQQRTTIKQAYDDVDQNNEDWILADLAEEIRQRGDMEDAYQTRAIKIIESLQNLGFIRSKSCEYALDWKSIMDDTETITVVSQSTIDEEAGRLSVAAYIVDAIYRTRRQVPGLPDACLILRELHEIAPHSQRESFSQQAKSLQRVIAQRITKVLRKGRFYSLEVKADTQYPSDINKGVRTAFNRSIAFNLGEQDLQCLFDNTPSSSRTMEVCQNTMTSEAGVGAVIGLSEPQVAKKGIEFLAPVQFMPSPAHHYDADSEHPTGLHTRCAYIDSEEMRVPAKEESSEWPEPNPSHLHIDGEDLEPETLDVEKNPMKSFVDKYIESAGLDTHIPTAEVRRAYAKYAERHDLPEIQENSRSFGRKFTQEADVKDNSRRNGEQSYIGIRFSDEIHDLLE